MFQTMILFLCFSSVSFLYSAGMNLARVISFFHTVKLSVFSLPFVQGVRLVAKTRMPFASWYFSTHPHPCHPCPGENQTEMVKLMGIAGYDNKDCPTVRGR